MPPLSLIAGKEWEATSAAQRTPCKEEAIWRSPTSALANLLSNGMISLRREAHNRQMRIGGVLGPAERMGSRDHAPFWETSWRGLPAQFRVVHSGPRGV